LALLAAGRPVLAAAMLQWQREEARLPPTKNGAVRGARILPPRCAATAAKSAKRWQVPVCGELVGDMGNLE